jgi:hypothetical protein
VTKTVGSNRKNTRVFCLKEKRKNFTCPPLPVGRQVWGKELLLNLNSTPVVTSSDDFLLTSVPLKKSSIFCWLHFQYTNFSKEKQ